MTIRHLEENKLRRVLSLTLALGVLGAFAFVNPATSAPPDHKNKYPDESTQQDCGDNTVTYDGPLYLWPPNHKLQHVSVTAAENGGAGDDAGPTSLTVMVSLLDATGGDGGPNHDPDYTPEAEDGIMASGEDSATVPFWLRAERSGQGEGRTYTIDWSASFGDGEMCSSMDNEHEAFTVFVPHDMRGGAGWKHDADGDGQGDNGKHADE